MATSKKKRTNSGAFLKRTYSFSLWQIIAFVVAFGALGVYITKGSFARGGGGDLSLCSISPVAPVQGDLMTVTAALPPVPADSRDGKYMVKNQTPYNTAYSDSVTYDATSGLATYPWNGGAVKGKYAFYFTYTKKGANPDVVAQKDIVRVSQTCSVTVP
jgi:hypothetical protein